MLPIGNRQTQARYDILGEIFDSGDIKMKRAGKIAASAAALMMVVGSAVAADVPTVIAPAAPPPPPPAPTFDWDGLYVGPLVGLFEPFDDRSLALGGIAGINRTSGRLLFGLDASAYAIFFDGLGGGETNAQLIARARIGLPLGAEGRALVYAGFGPGVFFSIAGGPDSGWYLSGTIGAELAVGESLSARISLDTFQYPGSLFEISQLQITGGLLWHFGR